MALPVLPSSSPSLDFPNLPLYPLPSPSTQMFVLDNRMVSLLEPVYALQIVTLQSRSFMFLSDLRDIILKLECQQSVRRVIRIDCKNYFE